MLQVFFGVRHLGQGNRFDKPEGLGPERHDHGREHPGEGGPGNPRQRPRQGEIVGSVFPELRVVADRGRLRGEDLAQHELADPRDPPVLGAVGGSGERRAARVNLIQALGGPWETAPADELDEPTVLDLVGLDLQQPTQGQSLVPLMTCSPSSWVSRFTSRVARSWT